MKAGIMPSGTEIKNENFNVKNLVEQIKVKKPVCKKCDLLSNQS
jgi:tRNA(Ile2) C34 agmatinyltransferase TiaS